MHDGDYGIPGPLIYLINGAAHPIGPSPLLQLQLRTRLHALGSPGGLLPNTPQPCWGRGHMNMFAISRQEPHRHNDDGSCSQGIRIFFSHFNLSGRFLERPASRNCCFSYTISHLTINLKSMIKKKYLIFKTD